MLRGVDRPDYDTLRHARLGTVQGYMVLSWHNLSLQCGHPSRDRWHV